jgi:hypothetical protein
MTNYRGSVVSSLDPFDVYQIYQSIKLHYTNWDYSAIKYHFKTSNSPQSFYKRNDKHFFAKLARQYTSKDQVLEYLVANFAYSSTPPWIGDIVDQEGEERHLHWKGIRQRLKYTFKNDVEVMVDTGLPLNQILGSDGGSNPLIIGLMISERIDMMSVLIIDKMTKFLKKENKYITDPIAWPGIYKRLSKTSPFINVANISSYRDIVTAASWSISTV